MNRRTVLRYGMFGVAASAASGALAAAGAPPAAADDAIVRCVIHPAFGIARVGNSPSDWFAGPETTGPHPIPATGFKDRQGRILRQAARFRVFGCDRDGTPVRELTAADADIRWSVHLANHKAAWFNFDLAFDVPGAQGKPRAPLQDAPEPLRSSLRNSGIRDRQRLAIDAGSRSVSGSGVNRDGSNPDLRFDTGRFLDVPVNLGELRTDEAGRLLVLGGPGAAAPAVPGLLANTFANNDLWHDDVADGPVDAVVRFGGRDLPVTGAWVVVGPPNYAPGIQSAVTMYDVMFEAACALEPGLAPPRPSFSRQIYPILERISGNQWVNGGFLRYFGWESGSDFTDAADAAALADPGRASAMLRRQVFERFRNPAYTAMEYGLLPPYYGDDVELPANNPRQWMAVLPIQYRWLEQWAAGDFDADWPDGGLRRAAAIEEIDAAEQPAMLDRAALDECLGGPFHPGCEMTWPMRQPIMYAAPFRLKRRSDSGEPRWGSVMTSDIALAPGGPLDGSGPGSVTRWMAVPWQTDTSSCLSRYKRDVDDFLPAFWPARVPNDVLAEADYETVMDAGRSLEDRQRAFHNRVKWLRGLPGFDVNSIQRVNAFIAQWSNAGIVTPRPGPADGDAFPSGFWVELGYAIDEVDPAGPPQPAPDLNLLDEQPALPPRPAATPVPSGQG